MNPAATSLSNTLKDPNRLAALHAVALLDTPTEEAFDRLTRLAARFTKAPVALVSLVDVDRQFFKSCFGLPEPWNTSRETPLSHSFCQHNRVAGVPLIVTDARVHPLFRDNLAIRDLSVIAYLGIPLVSSDSYVLGSFCVTDSKPRSWTEEDVDTVKDLAAAVMTEIDLRTEIAERKKVEGDRDKLAALYAALQKETATRMRTEKEKEELATQLIRAQRMEAIGALAGGIAHDFNNILSIIIGYTDLSLEDVEKGTLFEKNLNKVYAAGKRAKGLVEHILTLARQSDGELINIQLDSIVKEILGFIRSSIPATIKIKPAIESNSLILGNPTQVRQILMNLCTNAAYAMDTEGGVLGVTLRDITVDHASDKTSAALKPGDYIELKISDTGAGVSPEIIESIFVPFFATKPIGEGNAMGQSVAHGIVESYGGKITVDRKLGKGTVFTVYLPIAKKRIPPSPYELKALPTGTERILVIDDEAPIVKMAGLILERLGYQVTTQTSSVDALALFRRKANDFDLVITDMTMPNMTGDRLGVELMNIRSDIPVILCTGFSNKISEESTQKKGFKALTYKPIVKDVWAKTIRKVLDEAAHTNR